MKVETGEYTVYKHTSPSGKVYIGITGTTPQKRWAAGYRHSPHFYAAIKKYGWGNIKHEILADRLPKEVAEKMEVELIARYKATDRQYGYNADLGGSTGVKHTPETREKIGNANRKRVWTPEARQKIREWRASHPLPEEVTKRIGDANRGRKHRPESIEKIRDAQTKKAVRNLSTGILYASIAEASRACGLEPSKIVKVCKGKRKTHGGYAWAYEEVMP